MQPRGGHLCFNLVTARHSETLGEKIESAHDCKTDKTAKKKGKIPQEIDGLFFSSASASAPLHGSVGSMKG